MEFMFPEPDYYDYDYGWIEYAEGAEEEAISCAANALDVPRERVELKLVLMREETEVEARIHGHEWPCLVECTSRARSPQRWWSASVLSEGDG